MDIIMVLFYLFGHENTIRIGQFKKTRGSFCENIRTKWNGFTRRRTGFIRQQTGFIHRVDEASPPTDEASQLADEAIPIGPYIFFKLFTFLKCVLFVCSKIFTIRSSVKNCFF